MKRALLVLAFGIGLLAFTSCSQKKVGYYNSVEVLGNNPQIREADSLLAVYANSLEAGYETLRNEYNSKLQEFNKDSATLTSAMKGVVVKNLKELQQNLQLYTSEAKSKYDKRKDELYKPVIDKLTKVVANIAKESGYDYIFESNTVLFAYNSPKHNLTEQIKKMFSK